MEHGHIKTRHLTDILAVKSSLGNTLEEPSENM
jgi:hypothetical protein